MANLREAQKQMTRRLLLDAGLSLFVEKGYAPTTVDDVASAAGTTRVTFYAYFPSKADLMRALIAERLNESLERSRSPEHGSTAQSLVDAVADGSREALRAWFGRTAAQWDTIRPIIRIGRHAAAMEPDLHDLVERWLDEAISDVADGLARAGRFAPQERHFKGVLAMAQLDYVAQNWPNPQWELTEEQVLDGLTDSWVRLLNE